MKDLDAAQKDFKRTEERTQSDLLGKLLEKKNLTNFFTKNKFLEHECILLTNPSNIFVAFPLDSLPDAVENRVKENAIVSVSVSVEPSRCEHLRHPVVMNIISDDTYIGKNDNNSVYGIGIGIKKYCL